MAAFTVTSGPGGTVVLTLRKGELLDPAALRQALADHGIPAVVSVDKVCDTKPEVQPGGGVVRPHPVGLDQVLSNRSTTDGADDLTIDPMAMPAGTELSIGYFPNAIRVALVEAGASLSCTTTPGAASPPGTAFPRNNAARVGSQAATP